MESRSAALAELAKSVSPGCYIIDGPETEQSSVILLGTERVYTPRMWVQALKRMGRVGSCVLYTPNFRAIEELAETGLVDLILMDRINSSAREWTERIAEAAHPNTAVRYLGFLPDQPITIANWLNELLLAKAL